MVTIQQEDPNVTSPELRRIWQAREDKHNQAAMRRFNRVAAIAIVLGALAVVYYLAVAR